MKNKHIFLSYRSSEADFALRLAADLKNAGVNLWMDRLDIKPGDDWINALQKAVNDCAAIIAVVSPDYIDSKYCRRELARADRMGRPVFPVLLRPVPPHDWPFEIERRQYIDFSEWHDEQVYHQKLKELVKTLKEHVASQINPIPDLETRYLTSLIARLETRKGVLQYVELAAMTNVPASENAVRPKPHTEGGDGVFRPLSDAPGQEERPEGQRKIPFDSIAQAVEKYPRFVLIGAPGAGKTTAIQRLTLQVARVRQSQPEKVPLPLMLDLPAWTDDMSLTDFIRSQWPFDSDPMEHLATGKVLLYLDGLNEMGASGPAKAKMLRDWLHGNNPPEWVIVTCRSTDYYAGDLNLDLPTVVAEEMDEPRIRRFVTNYLGKDTASALLARVLPEDVQDLADTRHLFQLARNPFLLSVLILAYMSSPDGDLPLNMGSLIKRLVMELWERERVRQTPGWVPFEQMEEALSGLACAMIDENMPNYVSREYALKYVENETLLRAANSVNLIRIQGNSIHYSHQLILEYFAAVGLAHMGLPTKLMRPRFDRRGARVATKWDQVVIALSGTVSTPDLIVLQVAEVDPYLALECIASGIHVFESTRQEAITHLINFVQGDDQDGRLAAARVLGMIGDEASIAILMEVMRSSAWDMRQAAAHALRDIKIPTLPGLLEALHDWDQDIREATATAVRQIGASAVPVLLGVLDDDHWSMRRGAAWALGEIGDKAAVPGLVEALSDEDGLVRREAALALAWIRDQAAVPALLEALHDKDWRVRRAAAETLGWIGTPSLSGLLDALNDSSVNVRRVVAEALGRIGETAAVPALMDALYDDSIDVRAAVLEALGWIKDPASVTDIIGFLSDTTKLRGDQRRLCDVAAEALESINTLEAVTALHEWRQNQAPPSGEKPVRIQSDEDNSAISRFLVALKDEDGLKRWSAVKALAAFKDPAAIQSLLQALNDEDVLVCDAAAEALAKIGAPAVPGLLNALLDSNPNVRGAAVEALGQIGDTTAVPSLIECLSDTAKPWLADERICDMVVKALEQIGTSEATDAAREWRRVHSPLQLTGTPEQPNAFHRATLPDLLKALHSKEMSVRQEAATALREQAKSLRGMGHDSVLHVLTEALRDEQWFVRWAVAEALGWIGEGDSVPVLLEVLGDPNWMVRVAAIRALLEIGDVRAVSGFVAVLTDVHPLVREVAAESLGVMGNVNAVSGLVNALHDKEALIRRAATESLGAIGDPAVVPDLLRMLQDEDDEVRWAAAEALNRIGDASAVQELIGKLGDTYSPDWEEKRICDVAAEALQRIGTPEALQAVDHWRYSLSQD